MATEIQQLTVHFPGFSVFRASHVMIYGFSKSDVFFNPTTNPARAGCGVQILQLALKTLPGAALVHLNHRFRVRLILKFKFGKISSPVSVAGIVKVISYLFMAWNWIIS